MILPEVSVRLHTECAAILMPMPARHSRNIDYALDTDRGEKLTKIVMSCASHADLGCGAIHRFLCFANKENERVICFLMAVRVAAAATKNAARESSERDALHCSLFL